MAADMTDQIPRRQPPNTAPTGSHNRSRHSIGSFDTASISQFTDQTLYFHPSVRIIKFELQPSAAPASAGPILPDLDYPVDAIETLPWRVPTETIAALGSLKLENIASTTFLKSGSVIHALLKNCQGWCVDGESIFVLRIRKLTYYRIELPNENDDDKARVESFKRTLSTIIRYEVTPCPFKRGFSVELPEEAKTPRRKKAWTPKHSPSTRLKMSDYGARNPDDTSDPDNGDEHSDGSLSRTSETNISRPSSSGGRLLSPSPTPIRRGSRVVSEPAKSFDFLVSQFQDAPETLPEADDVSLSSSVDSFHSFNSSEDLTSPSLPLPVSSTPDRPTNESHSLPSRGHNRDASDVTVTGVASTIAEPPDSPVAKTPSPEPIPSNESSHHPRATSPILIPGKPSSPIEVEDPDSSVRQRLRAARKRDLSPLPPNSTLFSPAPRTPSESLRRDIIRKACSFLLEPPVQLILILLRLGADLVTHGDNIRITPWQDNGENHETWNEDDFGIPLTPLSSANDQSPNSPDPQPPGSWREFQ